MMVIEVEVPENKVKRKCIDVKCCQKNKVKNKN